MTPDPKIANDEVRAAETAIRHWEQELAARVKDVTALDGFFLSTLTSLLGTREAKVEAAIGRVQECRLRLASAKKALEQARARLTAAETGARQAADAEAERVMELELRADAIRGTAHPAAAGLARLELEGEEARASLAATTEALQATMGLLAATGGVLRAMDGAVRAVVAGLNDLPLADLWKAKQLAGVEDDLEAYLAKADRLQRALDALGMEWSVGGRDERVEGSSYAYTGSLVGEILALQSIEAQRDRFEALRDELRGLMAGFEGERRQRAEAVERLERERRALLEAPALAGRR